MKVNREYFNSYLLAIDYCLSQKDLINITDKTVSSGPRCKPRNKRERLLTDLKTSPVGDITFFAFFLFQLNIPYTSRPNQSKYNKILSTTNQKTHYFVA